jgi:hypothetical protein
MVKLSGSEAAHSLTLSRRGERPAMWQSSADRQ